MFNLHQFHRGSFQNRRMTYCLLRQLYTCRGKIPYVYSGHVLSNISSRLSQDSYDSVYSSLKSKFDSLHLQKCSIHKGTSTFCEKVVNKYNEAPENTQNTHEMDIFTEDKVHSSTKVDGVFQMENDFSEKSAEAVKCMQRNGRDEKQSERSEAVTESTQLTVPISEKSVFQAGKFPVKEPVSIIDRILRGDIQHCDSINTHATGLVTDVNENAVSTKTMSRKVYIPPIVSLSPIANESVVLKNLVELGVDVSVYVEKEMAEKVIKMDFDKEIKPYILFLHNAGVPDDKLGLVLTKNPYIFQHDLEHLQVRINYLLSKRFTKDQIGLMLIRESVFICMETKRIDAKLGFYQKEFRLKGQELRQVASRYAKLITGSVVLFKRNKVYMKEFLGFSDSELRTFFLSSPKTFYSDMHKLSPRFDYIHNVMGIPHHLIASSGWALNRGILVLQNRHRFLLKQGRAQYDPTKENYVSFRALLTLDKAFFCVEVAKASVAEFDNFQRLT